MDGECFACKSISGEKRISPGPMICEGKYWVIEHAYPVKMIGWLVIVHKEHIESLDRLRITEWYELTAMMKKTIEILRKETNCEKEYVMCLAEGEGFKHIHFHVIAKPKDLAPELRGAKIFALLKAQPNEAISPEIVKEFCEKLKDKFKTP
jgi:diadenosine tetraphosphate (Ap4A) HIT family hydrolase